MYVIYLISLCLWSTLHAADNQSKNAEIQKALENTDTLLAQSKKRIEENRVLLNTPYPHPVRTAAPLSGEKVKVSCNDSDIPIDGVPIEFVKTHFVTLKNMLNDLNNTETPIPLAQTNTQTFKCFAEFARILLEYNNDLGALEALFGTTMDTYPTVTHADLLNSANYLDFEVKTTERETEDKKIIKMIPELAHWYANILKTRPFNPTRDVDTMIGEAKLKLLAPGWLLHDLLSMDQCKMKTEKIQINNKSGWVPIISNSSAQGNFISLNETNAGTAPTKCLLFNLDKKSITTDYLSIDIDAGSKCAISDDEKYLLVTETIDFKAPIYKLVIFHIKDKYKPHNIQPDGLEDAAQAKYDAVLYNNDTQSFHVIISMKTWHKTSTFNEGYFKKKLLFYEIDPKNETELIKPTFTWDESLYESGHWSCVGKNLIGIELANRDEVASHFKNTVTPIYKSMLYNGKKLFDCSHNTKNKTWQYRPNEDSTIILDAPFTTIESEYLTEGFNPCTAIIKSFIPDFDVIVANNINSEIDGSGVFTFDAQNLCLNFYLTILSKGLFRTNIENHFLLRRGFDPKLTAAIQFLHQKVASQQEVINGELKIIEGNFNILKDVYFLYHYHVKPKKWESFCRLIWQDISSEIKKIYGLENYLISPTEPTFMSRLTSLFTTASNIPTTTTTSTIPATSSQKPAAPATPPGYPYQQEYEKTTKQQHTPRKTHTPRPIAQQPAAPVIQQQSFWRRMRQNFGQFQAAPTQYLQQNWQAFYNRYRTPVLSGAMATGGLAFSAWLWSKYSRQLPTHQIKPLQQMRYQ